MAGFIFSSFSVSGVQVPFVLVWLLFAATFFTLYFRFINLRAFRHGFQLVRGDYSDPLAAGEVTHFQALATALSGTVGLGNIAGVAVAVSLGGPGATFWMILAGLLGMSSKFVECTLGVKYRNEYTDGTVSGGPMYYLSKGLAERSEKLRTLGKVLAVLFAIFCIGGSFGGGNMFQANQSFKQLVAVTGGDASWLADKGWLFGVVIATLVGLVIIGGIQGIARVTSKIVPFMGVLYVAAGLIIIGMHLADVPAAFAAIVNGAFTAQGIAGGVVGVLIQGFKRAAFSNEAGIGSAAIAHSAVRTNRPVTEGFVALYEPFIDTVVVCTITALVIIVTGTWDPSVDPSQGVALTSAAFESTILLVSLGAHRGRGPVRLLHDDFLVLLRAEGLDLPVRRIADHGCGLQDSVPVVRDRRVVHAAWLGHRLLRRHDLRHGIPERARHLLPAADREA